jgi:hypothetical protein
MLVVWTAIPEGQLAARLLSGYCRQRWCRDHNSDLRTQALVPKMT